MGTGRPETEILRRVLEEAPSLAAVAVQLGVSRPTIYRWMREAGIASFHRRVRIPTHNLPDDGSSA